MMNKKGAAWVYIVIALILVGAGIGAYYVFSADGKASEPDSASEPKITEKNPNAKNLESDSIPKPPALPS